MVYNVLLTLTFYASKSSVTDTLISCRIWMTLAFIRTQMVCWASRRSCYMRKKEVKKVRCIIANRRLTRVAHAHSRTICQTTNINYICRGNWYKITDKGSARALSKPPAYRIYSINRPGRLLNFGPWEWALIKFSHFQQVKYLYFATKQ